MGGRDWKGYLREWLPYLPPRSAVLRFTPYHLPDLTKPSYEEPPPHPTYESLFKSPFPSSSLSPSSSSCSISSDSDGWVHPSYRDSKRGRQYYRICIDCGEVNTRVAVEHPLLGRKADWIERKWIQSNYSNELPEGKMEVLCDALGRTSIPSTVALTGTTYLLYTLPLIIYKLTEEGIYVGRWKYNEENEETGGEPLRPGGPLRRYLWLPFERTKSYELGKTRPLPSELRMKYGNLVERQSQQLLVVFFRYLRDLAYAILGQVCSCSSSSYIFVFLLTQLNNGQAWDTILSIRYALVNEARTSINEAAVSAGLDVLRRYNHAISSAHGAKLQPVLWHPHLCC